MCGINGVSYQDESLIQAMNAATQHRGPDGSGHFVGDAVTLGHNLLAITETAKNAAQPLVTPDRAYSLTYNGEIYNYQVLRGELEAVGEQFNTAGDTEVLFAGLCRYGSAFLERLDGMFALAFYDQSAGTLLLARDPSGMKPLYYSTVDERLRFSSELRGLFAAGVPRVLNQSSLPLFFSRGYVPGPHTLLRDIYKLCPGQRLTYNVTDNSYASDWFVNSPQPTPTEHTPEKLRSVLGKAVREHTMGLRPFGLFLSGGLDSTIILHELAAEQKSHINTFTTRFETTNLKYNEDATGAAQLTHDYAINHTELLVTEADFIASLEAAIIALEEPRFNPSLASYWLLYQRAGADITVVLGGSGGDEQFLGYPRYLRSKEMQEKYNRFPHWLVDAGYHYKAYHAGLSTPGAFTSLQDPLSRMLYLDYMIPLVANQSVPGVDTATLRSLREQIIAIGHPTLSQETTDIENKLGQLDRILWLADEDFIRNDKLSMNFGLEGRFPYVARAVSSYCDGIPSSQKIPPPYSRHSLKALLRESYRSHLPDYIIDKAKTGWNAPIPEWIQSDFGDYIKTVLRADYYEPSASLFDFNYIHRTFLTDKTEYTLSHLKDFLPIAYFQIWARAFKVTLS